MKRVMLTVAYDGTHYRGWQLQPNGETIESVLNRCLQELTGEEILVIGASRTDAGVHARGNIAVFDTARRFRRSSTPGAVRAVRLTSIGFTALLFPCLPKDCILILPIFL